MMRYVADFCVAAFIALACAAMAFGPLVACDDAPPSTDAGADPEISGCCLGLVLPWRDSPEACLRDLTDTGECRWLTCLGGLVEYEVCR